MSETGPSPSCPQEAGKAHDEEVIRGDDGVDVTLIRWMLSLTPSERLLMLQQTVRSIERLCNESSFT